MEGLATQIRATFWKGAAACFELALRQRAALRRMLPHLSIACVAILAFILGRAIGHLILLSLS
jgi:hypothetical protein